MNIGETIATWEAEEEGIREKLGNADVIPLSGLTTRSGMDIFNAMFAGELPHPPIGLTLDYTPIHMEKGIAVFQGRPKRHHYNPLGTVHGGWFCTLLDSAVGCAIHTLLPT